MSKKSKKSRRRFPFIFKVWTTADVWIALGDIKARTGLSYSELGRRGFEYVIKEYKEGRLKV